MRVRSEAFAHGALQWQSKCFTIDVQQPTASLDCVHIDSKVFDTLGLIACASRKANLGQVLKDGCVQDGAKVLKGVFQMLNGEVEVPKDEECVALLQMFCGLETSENGALADATSKFTLFLLLQAWHEMRCRLPTQEDVAVWSDGESGSNADNGSNSRVLNTSLTQQQTPALASMSKENEQQFQFIRSHLKEICWLISSPESPRIQFLENWDAQVLEPAQAEALFFILAESPEDDPIITCDQDKLRCSELESKLDASLKLDPSMNPTLCLIKAPEGSNSTHDETLIKGVALISHVNRLTHMSADVDLLQRSMTSACTISQNRIERDLRVGAQQPIEGIVIFNCTEATVYALRPSKNIRVVGCKKTTIVLGPCSGVLTVEHCSEVTVIGIAGYLSIRNSYDIFVHVQTLHGRPVLTGEYQNIIFGPYNTCYPRLELHLAAIKHDLSVVKTCEYLWKNPIDLSSNDTSAWSILPPSELNVFVVPFLDPLFNIPCVENPFRLPVEYAKAVQEKIDSVESLISQVANAKSPTDPKSNTVLQEGIKTAFREWLVSSGNARQVMDLIKLA